MLCAQNDSAKIPKNSVYIELGGKGQFYSINYERQLYKIKNAKGGLAIGGSYLGALTSYYTSAEHNIYIGRNIHNLELGAGVNYLFHTNPNDVSEKMYFNGRIGYRFQPMEKGFIARISYTPLFYPEAGLLNWVGLSFGYAF